MIPVAEEEYLSDSSSEYFPDTVNIFAMGGVIGCIPRAPIRLIVKSMRVKKKEMPDGERSKQYLRSVRRYCSRYIHS